MTLIKEAWLDDVTSPGATTDAVEVPGANSFGVQVTTANPAQVQVTLQGSIDGVNWNTILLVVASTASKLEWATGKPVKFIRLTAGNFDGAEVVSASVVAV